MKRLGLMLAAAAVISMADGTAHAKMAVQTFPVQAEPGHTTSILRPTVRSGLPRNPRASWAGSIRGPANQI